MRRAVVAVLVLAAAGCSLPLPSDVQNVHAVRARPREDTGIQVLPPGPKHGQAPDEIVLGFLGAQANADDSHAIARQFLTARAATTWQDDAEVQVYDPNSLSVHQAASSGTAAGRATVDVTSTVSGQVRSDGSYVARGALGLNEPYQLQRVKGEWRLTDVPAGLRLTPADRERSYEPRNIYYLALAGKDTPAHVVPDQVFLPIGGDPATTLVRRLLQPPSEALGGSVTSAFPAGTRSKSVSMSSTGVVTVDLAGALSDLTSSSRQALSAQLVWTLRGLGPSFTGLRLLREGTPFTVPTEDLVQGPGDWNAYDPEGLGSHPPYFFVASRRLRASVPLPPGPATEGAPGVAGAFAVDGVAVSPDRTKVALLDGVAPAPVTVRIGPPQGPTFTTGATAPGLSSPTWGSGQYGLWMLRGGRRVVLLANGRRHLQTVTVRGLPSGTLQSLAVSRDGARAALVVAGQLYVGRIAVVSGAPRIVDLSVVLPTLRNASRVAWSSGTELIVLGALTRPGQVLRLAVDGSSVTPLNTSGLTPVAVAASAAGLLVATRDGIYASSSIGFTRVQAGGSPVFPG